jgi:hypothetical protein
MIYIVGEIVPKANKKVEYIDEHSIDGKPDIDYSNRRDF